MSRVAQPKNKLAAVLAALVIIAGGVLAGVVVHQNNSQAQISTTSSQTTDVKYAGVQGQTALALLKKYAIVQTKHYSFGDQVTSINGSTGTGPKYWSFYVNGQLADVGAGVYTTKNGDQIEWKLQSL